LFVSLVLLLAAAEKKEKKAKNALKAVALVAGTLSNLYSLDIYGLTQLYVYSRRFFHIIKGKCYYRTMLG